MPWSHIDNRLYTKGIDLHYTVSADLEPKQIQSLLGGLIRMYAKSIQESGGTW